MIHLSDLLIHNGSLVLFISYLCVIKGFHPSPMFGFRSTTSMPTSSWTKQPWNQRRKEQVSVSLVGLRTPPHPLISVSWRRDWRKPRSTWHSNFCVEEMMVVPLGTKIRKTLPDVELLSRQCWQLENVFAFFPVCFYLFWRLPWSENFI